LTLHVIAFADGILAGTRPVSTATLDLYYLGWLGQMWTNPAATVLTSAPRLAPPSANLHDIVEPLGFKST
jgi:hypothetical protein